MPGSDVLSVTRAPVILFLAALLVRLAALAYTVATARFPEFWEYEVIARNLLAGRGFLYPFMNVEHWAYVEPLYPFLVAAVYLLTGHSVIGLGVVQCLVSALLAPVTFEFGRLAFGYGAGLAGAALVVIDPALVGYATKLHPVTLDALLIALVALALLKLIHRPGRRTSVLFGVATGGCVLTRPTILAFVLAALLWLGCRRDLRVATARALIGLGIAAALIAPWVARNYAVLGTFVLTRSHVGFGFWLGNHPRAAGGEGDPSDPEGNRSIFDSAPEDLRQRAMSQTNEIDQDRIFQKEAIRYVGADPLGFVGRTITKLYYFWWFPPYFGKLYAHWHVAVYRGFYVLALAAALVGMITARHGSGAGPPHGIRLAVLLMAAISLAQAMFYVQGRHRLGVEALLMVFSGAGLDWLYGQRAPSRIARLGSH